MSGKNERFSKLLLIYICFVLFGGAVIFRVFQIQWVEKDDWLARSEQITASLREVSPSRGNVYSADGRMLATSVPLFELRVDFKADGLTDDRFSEGLDSLTFHLAHVFNGKSAEQWKALFKDERKKGNRYFLLARDVDFETLQEIKEFPVFKAGRYKSGLIIQKNTKRRRPFGPLASRTIGYQIDGLQPVGIEAAYGAYLKGKNGYRWEKRLAGGVWMPMEHEPHTEPQDGSDVVTTLDMNIQDVAQSSLLKQLIKHDADHGTVVLMEVKTGNILAISNLSKNKEGRYAERYNYAIGESTEPGSTFKLPVLIAALDEGKIDITDTVDARNGVIEYYGHPMHDSKVGGYGKITVQEAFEMSSNIGLSQAILQAYGDNQKEFVDKLYSMGLNDKLQLKIPGEGRPKVKQVSSADNWSGISLTQMAIGYEVLLTPLQILSFYNAIANNGYWVKPRFVDRIEKDGEILVQFPFNVGKTTICGSQTVEKAKKLLEGVVERGTAKNLKKAPFKIAGKTGTARIANKKYGYNYESDYSYQASFVGYFPADNPRFSCIVVVNAPNNDVYYGNLVAGPIFSEIAAKVYATSIEYHTPINIAKRVNDKQIPASRNGFAEDFYTVMDSLKMPYKITPADWVATFTGADEVDTKEIAFDKVNKTKVPNVTGMGLRDALYVLEQRGLTVIANGAGVVKSQLPNYGENVPNSKTITLELSL
ncbi:MAG: cell division protein FtsI (penicillin-binding protein 3) [Luteibaculaceae bacterium]|jgi:cell division protein FtsI (penicillin-binding protein 3)